MGQRSQIYVRYNKKDMNGVNRKKLIANYYQWNYGERMIGRARWGIEFIKEYLSLGYNGYNWFEQPGSDVHLSRVFDANFDMHDISISSDIIKELCGFYGVSTETDYLKSELETAVKEEAEEEGLEINPIEQLFIEYIFTRQDNNDGKLFVDILEDGIKYCFLDDRANTDNIMDAAAYMVWDYQDCKETDWTKDEYIKPEQKENCRKNILAIGKMAQLMTKEEIDEFINYDYLEDMEKPPFC